MESQWREVQGDLSRKVKNELGAQFQCRWLQDGRQPWVLLPAEIPQNPMAGQQRQQISELQFDKFTHTPSSLMCWKIKFKTKLRSCSDFPWMLCFGSKHHDQLQVRIFRFLQCWTPRSPLLWTRSSKTLTSRRRSVSLDGTERPEGGPVSSRKKDRLHDIWLLSSYRCSWYRCRLRWFIFHHSSQW